MKKEKNQATVQEKLTSFPSETLTDCRDIISQIVKRKGETVIPFKEIAIILNKPISTITLPVSTCTQYGLLENVHGSGYRATDLFSKIERPVYESDRNKAILEALANAPLYRKLIDEFNGKILPDEKGMTNHLEKNFGIKPYLIQKVVRVFFKNFQEYNLINNDRLRFLVPISTIQENDSNDSRNGQEETKPLPPTPSPLPTPNIKIFEQAIDLGDEHTAYLKYPRNITLEQVGILRIHLEATLTALEARSKNAIKKEQPEGHSSTE